MLGDPAWLAGHSRTITGSDGTVLFYNDPGSGSLNQIRTWEQYKNTVITSLTAEKIEIIDTVVFHAPPRPAAERTGVIWLRPSHQGSLDPGSVALVSGATGDYVTYWHWDGSGSHSQGYYYEDLKGVLQPDPVFGVQFQAFHYKDYLDIRFHIKNISDQYLDYSVNVILTNEGGSVNEVIYTYEGLTISPGILEYFHPIEGYYRIANKPPGLYTLRFVLEQSGVVTDSKWVQFRLHEQDVLFIHPHGFLIKNAFCRKGPDTRFEGVKIYEEGTEVKLMGVNPERTWGQFEREIDGELIRCWIAFSVVDLTKEEDSPVIPVPTLPPDDKPEFSCSNYKNEPDCMADSRCNWVFGLVPGNCTEK